MNEDELYRLNSMHRFRKHSQLVLESYDHCEVPAGCGGVVLRWLDPRAIAPLVFEVVSSWRVHEAQLDEQPVRSGGVALRPGPHVLSCWLSAPTPTKRVPSPSHWLFASARRRGVRELLVETWSHPDGSWRVTAERPAEGWRREGFDDATWQPLEAGSLDLLPSRGATREAFDDLNAHADVLAVPSAAPKLWLRHPFVLPEVK